MPKHNGRVRNWSQYNKALQARGSVTLWIDEGSLQNWYEGEASVRGRGRPKTYSDTAVRTMLTLQSVYHLTLRSCHGFVVSLMQLMGLPLRVPSYSCVCRRQGALKLPRLPSLKRPIHLVIDSTGLKLYGEGEWRVRRHGWRQHRRWRKLHLGVDEYSQLIVTADCTGNDCSDDKLLPELLDQYAGPLAQVSLDGAYDSHRCFDEIARRGAQPTIPPQPNPRHKPKSAQAIRRPRDAVVVQVQQQGRQGWKQASGYHRRSLAETAMYRYKQLFGAQLKARKLDHQKKETLIRCHVLNKMTLLNRPFDRF